MSQRLSDHDYETLCAYLDGELPERERVKLESRLSRQPELRAGLEELRQTSLLLRGLPRLRAPRNFTIPAMAARKTRAPAAYPFLRLASAIASVLFVIVIAGDLALGFANQNLARNIPPAAPAAAPLAGQTSSNSAAATAAPQLPAAPALKSQAPLLAAQPTGAAATESPAAAAAPVGTSAPAGLMALPPTLTAEPTPELATPTPSTTPGGFSSLNSAPPTPTLPLYGLGAGEPETATATSESSAAGIAAAPTATAEPSLASGAGLTGPSLLEESTPTAMENHAADAHIEAAAPTTEPGLRQTVPEAAPTAPVTNAHSPLSLPITRPELRIAEIGLAAVAILAGLAALLVKK